MACNSPEFASHGVCATRHSHQRPHHNQQQQRDGSKEFAGAYCHDGNMRLAAGTRLARGKGRTIRCAQIHSSAALMTAISAHASLTRSPRPRVADLDRRADRDHGAGWRRHAPDRVRAFDRRMEAGHRRAAAAQPGAMDAGLRGLQDHPAISPTQRRHESRRVQDDLLVGMEPPAARARDRRGLSAAVSLVSVARRAGRGPAAAVVADLRPRRAAGRGRLVDGGVGTFATGRGFALSSRHPSGAGAADFCSHRLDAAPAGSQGAVGCVCTAENHGR